jgi:hypothetical protein
MAALLEHLLQRHPVWRGAAAKLATPAISTGYHNLDRELPGGGWPAGALTEILYGQAGIGELGLVLPAARALSWAGKRMVWLAPPHLPYAPALAAAGVDLAQLALVHAPARRDALWAAEQVLRARSCYVLFAWLPHASYKELRRLAVAAQGSAAWVALFRPAQAALQSSPAALRMAVEPGNLIRILKRRGTPASAPLHLALQTPFHALGRHPFPLPAAASAGADRRVGVPVHA